MAYSLEVAETEIENLKEQFVETKRSFEKAISKMDRLEQDIATNNILLTRLDMTQSETLKVVKAIVDNGGTGRCMERGVILQQLETKIKEMSSEGCKGCLLKGEVDILKERFSSFMTKISWFMGIVSAVCAGYILFYLTR